MKINMRVLSFHYLLTWRKYNDTKNGVPIYPSGIPIYPISKITPFHPICTLIVIIISTTTVCHCGSCHHSIDRLHTNRGAYTIMLSNLSHYLLTVLS